MTYTVDIDGEAAEEVRKSAEAGESPGEIVSEALAIRKWLRESAGDLYIKRGSKFVEVAVTK
jgi:hypothetical protein